MYFIVFTSHLKLSEKYFLDKKYDESRYLNLSIIEHLGSNILIDNLSYDPLFKAKFKEQKNSIVDYVFKKLSALSIPEYTYRQQFKNDNSKKQFIDYRDNLKDKITNNENKDEDTKTLLERRLSAAINISPQTILPLLNQINLVYSDDSNKYSYPLLSIIAYPKSEQIEINNVKYWKEFGIIFQEADESKLSKDDIDKCYELYTIKDEHDPNNLITTNIEILKIDNLTGNFFSGDKKNILEKCKINLYSHYKLFLDVDDHHELKPKEIQSRVF